MGTGRKARPSEVVFDIIWVQMKNLANCVWHPLLEEVEEDVPVLKRRLDEMLQLMKKEHEDFDEGHLPKDEATESYFPPGDQK